MYYVFLQFSSQKVFIISTLSGFVIYLLRVIHPLFPFSIFWHIQKLTRGFIVLKRFVANGYLISRTCIRNMERGQINRIKLQKKTKKLFGITRP